jgi:hypothetical protein
MSQDNNNSEILNFIASSMEHIRADIDYLRENAATKDDIARLETRIVAVETQVTAARGDIEQVQLRLDSIDKNSPYAWIKLKAKSAD